MTIPKEEDTQSEIVDVEGISEVDENSREEAAEPCPSVNPSGKEIANVLLEVVESEWKKLPASQTSTASPGKSDDGRGSFKKEGSFKVPTPVKQRLAEMSPLKESDCVNKRIKKIGTVINSQIQKSPERMNTDREAGTVPSPLQKLAAICPGILGGGRKILEKLPSKIFKSTKIA